MDSAKQLPAEQTRFVEKYLVDPHVARAAIRTGYSQRTASEMGHEDLAKPRIGAAIANLTGDDLRALAARARRPEEQ